MKHLITVVALATVVAACSGGGGGSPTGSPTPTAPAALTEECVGEIGPFVEALFEVDSRLDVGLVIRDYGEKLADAKVAYDRIKATDLDADCLSAATDGEAAYDSYVEAYTAWDDCIDDSDCDVDTEALPGMRVHWGTASSRLDKIRSRMP